MKKDKGILELPCGYFVKAFPNCYGAFHRTYKTNSKGETTARDKEICYHKKLSEILLSVAEDMQIRKMREERTTIFSLVSEIEKINNELKEYIREYDKRNIL